MLSTHKAYAYDFFAVNSDGDTLYYNIISTTPPLTAEVTVGNNAYRGDIIIPNSVIHGGNTYLVTAIGDSAFYICGNLTSVALPNTIKTIGDYAFFYCSSLTAISIPDSVISIGMSAFSGCQNLTTVDFNAVNCTFMGTVAYPVFYNCSAFTRLNIGQQVETIPAYAFQNCSRLDTVVIPHSTTTIGDYAFYYCSSLTSITIPPSVTGIGNYAFRYCSGLTSVAIPHSVTSIGSMAFSSCFNLTTVDFNAVNCTFTGTNGGGVFYDCSAFTRLNIGQQVQTIPAYAFYDCRELDTVVMPHSVTTIGDYAFYYCSSLTSITIPPSVTGIGNYAFRYCSGLTSVAIPHSVMTIGNMAFSSCFNLTTVDFNAVNCTSMGTVASPVFYDCSAFTRLNIGQQVETIPAYAFYDCHGLDTVVFPHSVRSIGERAFQNCYALACVKFGNGINSIRDYAFASANIREIYIDATTPPQIAAHTFENIDNTIPVYVKCGVGNDYKNASYWRNFINVIDDASFVITLRAHPQEGVAKILQFPCENDTAIIIATPNRGYNFTQWNDGNTDNPRTVVMIQDTTFEAKFETMIFQITILSNDTTMGTVSGSGKYETNSTISANAIPKENYYFIQWNDGNKANPRTIIVFGDSIFTAIFSTFKEGMFLVSVFPHNPDMGEVSGGGYYDRNTPATIAATAYPGNRFVCWNDGNTQNPRTITVTKNITFVASFEHITAIEDIETKHAAIYPNPAKENISIILPENVHHAVFTLYDMQGKTLIRQQINNQTTVSVNNLAAGMYIYNVRTNKQNYKGKVLIND
jgi:predicted RNA-binding protein with PUA-like domain